MPEKSNDHGFAMTGSYTCMALTALLVFDSISTEEKSKIVKEIHQMGESVIQREDAIQKIVDLDFDRIIYLGSGSLEGLAKRITIKSIRTDSWKNCHRF